MCVCVCLFLVVNIFVGFFLKKNVKKVEIIFLWLNYVYTLRWEHARRICDMSSIKDTRETVYNVRVSKLNMSSPMTKKKQIQQQNRSIPFIRINASFLETQRERESFFSSLFIVQWYCMLFIIWPSSRFHHLSNDTKTIKVEKKTEKSCWDALSV